MQADSLSLKYRTAMIADDDPIMREVLLSLLCQAGFQVVGEAATTDRAILLFQSKRPEIVCLDLGMPGLGGLDALANIRAASSEVIILVISADTTERNVRKAAEIGADGIIAKPFTMERLTSEIARTLERRRSAAATAGAAGPVQS